MGVAARKRASQAPCLKVNLVAAHRGGQAQLDALNANVTKLIVRARPVRKRMDSLVASGLIDVSRQDEKLGRVGKERVENAGLVDAVKAQDNVNGIT